MPLPIPLPLLLAGLYGLPGLILAVRRCAARLESPAKPPDPVLLLLLVLEAALWPVALFYDHTLPD